MTESQRVDMVEGMFPDWREHLNDGKVIDNILDGLVCPGRIVLNRCSRPSCNNTARAGRKTCIQCATKASRYMSTYVRRKPTALGRGDISARKPVSDQQNDIAPTQV